MPRVLAIITGSSRGLGEAIAARLLAADTRVLGIARRHSDTLAALAAERNAALEQWRFDLAEPTAAARQLETWLAGHAIQPPARSVLINNAGAVAAPGPFEDADDASLLAALHASLDASIVLTAAFLRATRAFGGERRVLNISSGLGRRAMAGSAVYCAAKAGLDHFSRAVALEQAALPHGARIVSLAPGVIDTDMQRELRSADPARFRDQATFASLHASGQLLSASRLPHVCSRSSSGPTSAPSRWPTCATRSRATARRPDRRMPSGRHRSLLDEGRSDAAAPTFSCRAACRVRALQ